MGRVCKDCGHDAFNHIGVKKLGLETKQKAKCFVLGCKCTEYVPKSDKKVEVE